MSKTRLIINSRGSSLQTPQTPPASSFRHRRTLWRLGVSWLAALLLLGGSHFNTVGGTLATFSDPEVSAKNVLQAGLFTFQLAYPDTAMARLSDVSTAVGTVTFALDTQQPPESLPAVYTVKGSLSPSAPTGCAQLHLEAQFGDYTYAGLFTEFVSLPMSALGSWTFTLSLPESNPDLASEAVCAGEVYFETGLANTPDHTQRVFSDDQHYTFEVRNWPAAPVAASVLTPPIVEVITEPEVLVPPAEFIEPLPELPVTEPAVLLPEVSEVPPPIEVVL